jgi:predicted deacylase
MLLSPVTFKGTEKGPRFLVLGAVHGNEKCGTEAIRRVIGEIEAGKIKILKGQVTFVPICNPKAYEQDVRFIDRNLNRFLVPVEKPKHYEDNINNELCPILASSDVVLDIHSYTAGGAPFANVEGWGNRENEYALTLGAYALVGDWKQAYADSRKKDANPDESVGTSSYARRFGAMSSVLECGQHRDPEAREVAYRAIHNALRYLGIVEGKPELPAQKAKLISIRSVVYRTDNGTWAENWGNFAQVKKGQLLATRANGEIIAAPEDGVLVMPKFDVAIGGEWFYFGVEK